MTTSELLHRLGSSFAKSKKLALSTVGQRCMGHGHFFERVREGRVTIRRADRAIQWFSDHWPSDLDWPADIVRPEPTPDSPAALAEDAA